jgi:hypothetical protein
MANPVYRYYTTLDSGPQAPIPLDWLPITQDTVAVWLSADAAYSIEATLDDLNPPQQGGQVGASPTPRWFPLADFPAGTSVSKYAALFNPWMAIRINIEMTTGDIELKVQQALNTGPRG